MVEVQVLHQGMLTYMMQTTQQAGIASSILAGNINSFAVQIAIMWDVLCNNSMAGNELPFFTTIRVPVQLLMTFITVVSAHEPSRG